MTDWAILKRAGQDVIYALQGFVQEIRRYARKKWRAWKYPR